MAVRELAGSRHARILRRAQGRSAYRAYRVPGSFLDYAARLLPDIGVDVGSTTAASDPKNKPILMRWTENGQWGPALVSTVTESFEGPRSVAVAAPAATVGEVLSRLGAAGIDAALPGHADSETQVVVGSASQLKGMEFDAVVVVEPGEVLASEGPSACYVVLTRAARQLTVLHTHVLPPQRCATPRAQNATTDARHGAKTGTSAALSKAARRPRCPAATTAVAGPWGGRL